MHTPDDPTSTAKRRQTCTHPGTISATQTCNTAIHGPWKHLMIGNNGPDGLCGRKATFEEEAREEHFALLVALLLWGADDDDDDLMLNVLRCQLTY